MAEASGNIQDRQQRLWENGDELVPIRKSWIADAVLGHAYCSSTPRPTERSTQQDEWDAHYFAKSLSLEMFFSPKECMEVYADSIERCREHFMTSSPEKDAEQMTVVCNLQNVRGINCVPDRFKGGDKMQMICEMEADLVTDWIHHDSLRKIEKQLEDAGATEDFLGVLRESNIIYHGFETILENPKVILEDKKEGEFQLLNRSQLAMIYGDQEELAPKQLTDQAVMEFIHSHPWSTVRVSPRSNYFYEMKQAGLENVPLAKALDTLSSKSEPKLSKAITGAVRTLFLCHKMGVVAPQKIVRGEDIYYRENFGRVAMFVQRSVSKGKYQSGILPEYRKILAKAVNGKKNPGVYLGKTGTVDPNLSRQWYQTPVAWMSGAIVHSTSPGRDPNSVYRSVAATHAYRKQKAEGPKTRSSAEPDLPF